MAGKGQVERAGSTSWGSLVRAQYRPSLASGLVEPFRVILAVLCAIFVQLLLDELLQTIRVRALLAFVQVPIDPEEEGAAVGLFKPLCRCGRVVPGQGR
jgi:hypothetical protein